MLQRTGVVVRNVSSLEVESCEPLDRHKRCSLRTRNRAQEVRSLRAALMREARGESSRALSATSPARACLPPPIIGTAVVHADSTLKSSESALSSKLARQLQRCGGQITSAGLLYLSFVHRLTLPPFFMALSCFDHSALSRQSRGGNDGANASFTSFEPYRCFDFFVRRSHDFFFSSSEYRHHLADDEET